MCIRDSYKYARHRYQGYADALRRAGLTVDGALVANVTEMGFDSSLAVARQRLLGSERPDAILAASDMYASAVVKAATSEGIRIPDDLAPVSYTHLWPHPSLNGTHSATLGALKSCRTISSSSSIYSARPWDEVRAKAR